MIERPSRSPGSSDFDRHVSELQAGQLALKRVAKLVGHQRLGHRRTLTSDCRGRGFSDALSINREPFLSLDYIYDGFQLASEALPSAKLLDLGRLGAGHHA